MRTTLATLSLLLATTFSAIAADEVIEAPADINPARFSWTGAYIGVSAGHAWMRDVDQAPPAPLVGPFHDKGNDWGFGAHAGFLYQFDNNFVVGAELEYAQYGIAFENLAALGVDISMESATTPKIRLGYGIDRFLVSGNIGASYVTTEMFGQTYLKDWGLTLGAGVDYAFTDNITAGLNYSHTKFEEFDGSQIDAKLDTFSARLGYKF